MRLVFLLLALLCIGGGVLFGALNAQPATVDFYWFSFDGSLGALLLIAAFVGALAGGAALIVGVIWPLRRRLRRAQREQTRVTDFKPPVDALPVPVPDRP